MNKLVEDKLPELIQLCQRNGIIRMELFGSAARDDFQPPTSDLDFIATFDHSKPPGVFDSYLDTLQQLEDLFGRKVDLVEADAVTNPFLRDAIQQDRTVLCERLNGTVMAKDPGTYLHDAAMALAAIARYIAGRSLDDYLRDDLLQAAVERRFEIAAEALNQLSKRYPLLASNISNLSSVVAFRKLLAHEYSVVNNRRVWELAEMHAPALLREIEAILQDLPTEDQPP